MTRPRTTYLALIAILLSPMVANADVITITGEVTVATGAMLTLVPPGTPVAGPMDIDALAITAGLAGPGDINSIDVNVGGFCFSTGPDATQCPTGGAYVPITSVNPITALTFSGGLLGGILDVQSFSLTFGIFIPIMFDFTAGTFFANGGALGTASGDIAGTYVFTSVPEPGTLALIGIGLLGMGLARRRRIA